MRVFVADYHEGSHTHALHFLLSGDARCGKTPVELLLAEGFPKYFSFNSVKAYSLLLKTSITSQ